MKLIFNSDEYNFIEFSKKNDKIIILLSSRDSKNSNKTIINSVEISIDQFEELTKSVRKEE